MKRQEAISVLSVAIEELKSMIDLANENLKKNIRSTDIDPPDLYDYQTVHEMQLLERAIEKRDGIDVIDLP